MKTKIAALSLCLLAALVPAPKISASSAPPSAAITLRDFKLSGELADDHAIFTLTATACVDNPHGGSLNLLSGPVALMEVGPHPKWHVGVEQNRFVLAFDRDGKFPIHIKFSAAIHQGDGWNSADFLVPPSA